jgi:muramidase (phage lysozyme)
MLKQVRGIGHEFDRLKLAGKLSLEWLAVHILNLNKGGVAELKSQLRSFTETIFEKIPIWTKQLAEFLDVPIKLALTVIRFLGDVKDVAVPVLSTIWNWLIKIWDMMAPWSKQLVILSGLLIAVFSPLLGPIAAATVALTTFFLLLEDFYAYCDGRKSSELLEPFWEFAEFLKFTLQKTILSVIVIADHLWTALKGKKHESGLGWKEHLEKELAELEKLHFDEKAERDRKREEAKKAIADEQAKEKAVAPSGAPTPTKLPTAIAPQEKELLNVIARGEGTSDEQARKKGYSSGYDVTLGYGAYGGKTAKPLTEMTLAEIEQHQTKMLADPKNKLNSSALGKYQFTRSTLFGSDKDIGELARLGISKDEKFTPELQDRLALSLIWKQTEQFKKGSISQSQYQNVLAGRWASIARADTGLSQYRQRVGTTSSDLAKILPGIKNTPQIPFKPIVRRVTAPTTMVEKLKAKRLQTAMDQYKEKTGIIFPGDMTKTTPGVKSMPQTPPGSPVYAKASEATSEETYNVNVTINAQTADPKQIADEATKGVKRSIQELRKEKFDKVIRYKVAVT